jgi:hypothetical protein
VSPFNSLRRETRAFGVRVLAGVGVFCALGAALIAFTADGVLADAEATETGAPTQAADPAVAPEPVLGAEENTAMAATPTEPAHRRLRRSHPRRPLTNGSRRPRPPTSRRRTNPRRRKRLAARA